MQKISISLDCLCLARYRSTVLADDAVALPKIPLFVAKEMGFTKCRIPGIVVTSKGTLIAWCEAAPRQRG